MKCRVCSNENIVTSVLPDVCISCTEKAIAITKPTHGLGDKVASVAKKLGFEQTANCRCSDRQKALNNVKLDGPPGAVARAMLEAILNPPKEEK
jgi:hypothetical protein